MVASAPTWQAHGLPAQPGGGAVEMTVAPCAAATSPVASVELSSTTMTSWGAGSRARTDVSRTGSVRSSSRAGTTIDTVAEPAPPRGPAPRRGVGTRARSSTPATMPKATRATCCTAQPRRSSVARAAAATFTRVGTRTRCVNTS